MAIDEPPEVAPFINELATSRTLYIRIRSLNAGRTTAAFKVDGAQAPSLALLRERDSAPLFHPR